MSPVEWLEDEFDKVWSEYGKVRKITPEYGGIPWIQYVVIVPGEGWEMPHIMPRGSLMKLVDDHAGCYCETDGRRRRTTAEMVSLY